MQHSSHGLRLQTVSAIVGQALTFGMLALGFAMTPTIGAMADDQQFETLILNRGRTFVGTIVDANRNTVAIRKQAGVAEIVRTDDIQTVYIPARTPGDKPFFGSFVDWAEGVYQLNINFELVRVKDGVMQGEPVPLARAQPTPALADRDEPEPTKRPAARPSEPANSRSSEVAVGEQRHALSSQMGDQGDAKPVLRIDAQNAAEDVSAVIYRLTLSDPIEQPLYVAYSTSDGTARAGEDYQAERDVLVIPAGEQNAELAIPLIDDDQAEEDETFSLSIGASNQLVRIDRSGLEMLIVDNDG